MSATSIGAAIGAAIDASDDGSDSVADGALIGAIVANVVKFTVPLAIVGGIGFVAWRKINGLKARWNARREATA